MLSSNSQSSPLNRIGVVLAVVMAACSSPNDKPATSGTTDGSSNGHSGGTSSDSAGDLGGASGGSSSGGTSILEAGAGNATGSTSVSGGDQDAASGADSGAFALTYPSLAVPGDVSAGLAQLNAYRATLGENAVTLDDASSAACAGHIAYLVEEAAKLGTMGYLDHHETDAQNSNSSAANAAAGLESDLAWGQSTDRNGVHYQSLGEAVDLWINGLYHRTPLLDPGLVKVGAASNTGYSCLDYAAVGNRTAVKLDAPTLWPPDGMNDVPRTFAGNEGPCPTASDPAAATSCGQSGYIPSVLFYNWKMGRQAVLQSVASVQMTDSSGNPIPLFAWYADGIANHDPDPGALPEGIALVPQMTLAANAQYQVAIAATVQGTEKNIQWTFSTGARAE